MEMIINANETLSAALSVINQGKLQILSFFQQCENVNLSFRYVRALSSFRRCKTTDRGGQLLLFTSAVFLQILTMSSFWGCANFNQIIRGAHIDLSLYDSALQDFNLTVTKTDGRNLNSSGLISLSDVKQTFALDKDTRQWSKAYVIHDKERGDAMIGIVLLRHEDWLNNRTEFQIWDKSQIETKVEIEDNNICRVGNKLLSTKVVFSVVGFSEDRGSFHVYRIECYFSHSLRLQTAMNRNNGIIHYNNEAIVVSPDEAGLRDSKLTMCIPTFFGDLQFRPTYWAWINQYVDHYENVHALELLFVYTTSEEHYYLLKLFAKVREREGGKASIVPIFINKESDLSHYYSQRVGIFDCFYRSSSLGSEWIIFNDFDEVLQPIASSKPILWSTVLPSNVTAVSFPVWQYSVYGGDYIGPGCSGSKHNGKEPTDRPCETCDIAWKGRRKYALRGDVITNLYRPWRIHEFYELPEPLSENIIQQTGMAISGESEYFVLRHIHLETSLSQIKFDRSNEDNTATWPITKSNNLLGVFQTARKNISEHYKTCPEFLSDE